MINWKETAEWAIYFLDAAMAYYLGGIMQQGQLSLLKKLST
jgi:hypothetical protein